MIVPLTKKKKKKNCFEYITGYTLPMLLRTKQNYYWNLLIETRLQRYLCTFDISFFLISEMEKHDRERERKNRNRVYIYRDVDVDRNLGSASSPINNYDIVAAAKRFNQCHRANFRSPLASTSLLPLFLHHRLATPQEITIETQAEVAIYQFPGWTPRLNAGDRDSRFPRCGQRGKSIDSSQVSASSLAPFIRPGRLLFNRPVQRPRNRRLLETTPSFGRSIIYAVNN